MLDFFKKCKSRKPLYNKGQRESSQQNPVLQGSADCHRLETLCPILFPIYQSDLAQNLSYRVLNPKIGIRIREIIRQICDSKDIQIIKGNVSQNHVHIYVSYPPKISVSEMVRFFKGRSSRKIQEEFPQLSKKYWGKRFWGIGYAAFSSGHVTDEMIQNYLKNHKNDPNHNDDDFKVE